MEAMQMDIFGNEISLQELEKREIKNNTMKKYKTMQELYGCTESKTCKTCKHLLRREWSKVYYKCELWILSRSTATDIRLKDTACGMYEDDN